MNIIEALVLGLVQGLTEFIPVSSSGHLVLLHEAFGIQEGGLVFDVALHLGTLIALLSYFWRDIYELVLGLFGKNDKRRLALLLAAATLPAVVSGVLLESAAESRFRSVSLVSINLMVVAVFMLIAERVSRKIKHRSDLNHISLRQAAAVGLAQAAAIVPGVSRSGSTITAGIFLGMDRVAAMRFSFLLGIPITAGALLKVLAGKGLSSQGEVGAGLFLAGIITAFLSGVFAIRFLLQYLSRHSLALFAYYRIALGALVLLIVMVK